MLGSFLVRLVSCLHSLLSLSKPSRERWNVREAWNLRGGGVGVRPGSAAECFWASSSASPGLEEMTRAASQACCTDEITSGQKYPACCKMLSGAGVVEPFFLVHLLCARQCAGFEGQGLVVGPGGSRASKALISHWCGSGVKEGRWLRDHTSLPSLKAVRLPALLWGSAPGIPSQWWGVGVTFSKEHG